MLKDLTYNDFWHVEDGDRTIPTIKTGTWRGHYDDNADTKRWKIIRNGHRPKHFKNWANAETEVKIRNFRDFGVYFNPVTYGVDEITAVFDSLGGYMADIQSLVFNYTWDELSRLSSIKSNDTRDCKVFGTEYDGGYLGFDIWISNRTIESFGYTAYSANPHATNLVYVFDKNAVLIGIYIANSTENYDTVGEIDYVIEARRELLKEEIKNWH